MVYSVTSLNVSFVSFFWQHVSTGLANVHGEQIEFYKTGIHCQSPYEAHLILRGQRFHGPTLNLIIHDNLNISQSSFIRKISLIVLWLAAIPLRMLFSTVI